MRNMQMKGDLMSTATKTKTFRAISRGGILYWPAAYVVSVTGIGRSNLTRLREEGWLDRQYKPEALVCSWIRSGRTPGPGEHDTRAYYYAQPVIDNLKEDYPPPVSQ